MLSLLMFRRPPAPSIATELHLCTLALAAHRNWELISLGLLNYSRVPAGIKKLVSEQRAKYLGIWCPEPEYNSTFHFLILLANNMRDLECMSWYCWQIRKKQQQNKRKY